MELSTEGKGLGGGGQKTIFNREHEYLSSLGAVGVFFVVVVFLLWLLEQSGREEGEVGGPEEPS